EVRQVIAWCNEGPSGARVDDILVDWEDYRGEFDSFDVAR
ncbi:MAG: acylphosphatase, partial [Desulfuromonadales bacterium]|nr:acylphosphatase [Desulfuromonadales bacterium]NIS40699.1 acylphosphatase [Desulfuromonadales bacterium]